MCGHKLQLLIAQPTFLLLSLGLEYLLEYLLVYLLFSFCSTTFEKCFSDILIAIINHHHLLFHMQYIQVSTLDILKQLQIENRNAT